MKVFVIPSWYSISGDNISGSFFREQSLAVIDDNHQVSLLYGGLAGKTNMFSKENYRLTKKNDSGMIVYYYVTPSFKRARVYRWKLRLFRKHINKVFNLAVSESGLPDILHAHSYYPAGIVAIELGRKFNIPVIVTEHSSLILSHNLSNCARKNLTNVVRESAKFICVSPALKNKVERISETKNKIEIIPNMVNKNFFLMKTLEQSNNPFTFLSVGSLIERKRHDVLISAFCNAFSTTDDVELIILGEGELHNDLLNQIITIKREKQIKLLGQRSRQDIVKIMRSSNCFALASQFETFGVVYIEALASGLPIITCKNGGSDALINAKNGVLLEAPNVEDFSIAMRHIYLHIDDYNKQSISDDCILDYGSEAFKKRIQRIYHEVVNAH